MTTPPVEAAREAVKRPEQADLSDGEFLRGVVRYFTSVFPGRNSEDSIKALLAIADRLDAYETAAPASNEGSQVRVTPLGWQRENVDGTFWTGWGKFGREYRVRFEANEWRTILGMVIIARNDNSSAAKVAADEHYAAEVLSALASHPAEAGEAVSRFAHVIKNAAGLPDDRTVMLTVPHREGEEPGELILSLDGLTVGDFRALTSPASTPEITEERVDAGALAVARMFNGGTTAPSDLTKQIVRAALTAALSLPANTSGQPVTNPAETERVAGVAEALNWAMDEIDVLSNKLSGFAYPQGMVPAQRSAVSLQPYVKAVEVRKALSTLPDTPKREGL